MCGTSFPLSSTRLIPESLSAQQFHLSVRLASRSTHRNRSLRGPSVPGKVNILPDAFRPSGICTREPRYARLTPQVHQSRRTGIRRGEELRYRSVCFHFGSHPLTLVYPISRQHESGRADAQVLSRHCKAAPGPSTVLSPVWLNSPHVFNVCRCFSFQGSVELAWHNNLYRAFARPASVVAREVRKLLQTHLLLCSLNAVARSYAGTVHSNHGVCGRSRGTFCERRLY
jgi:hypothetical protein